MDVQTEAILVSLLKDLAKEGKTVIVVHHDLTSVKDYFDNLVLVNVRVIASGSVDEVFTHEYLEETYGSKVVV